jgi:SulP family sulfate permease
MRPRRHHIVSDLIAGLTFAAVNIPQGLAYALMAGVNPVFGLYTLMIATPIGALVTGSVYMNVSSTSALAASTGDVMETFSPDQRATALVTLVLFIGVFQFVLGVLKLGFIMQFVPNSVMVGFTNGVAVLIILGQLGDFTGYYSPQSNKVLQAADLLLHRYAIVPQTLVVGFTTIALILLFERSRFSIVRNMALFLAMAVASALPWIMSWSMVETVQSVADIPQSLPVFTLPDLSLVTSLLVPAMALGLLGLVQGASVAQMFPNPDGKFSINSRDFLGQGIANLAASFFQGIPAGGSTSSTAIVVNAGAQSRWANIFGGLLVLIIVLLVGNWAEMVAMPALAGLLIVVGARMLNLKAIINVWRTGPIQRVSEGLTFAAALIVPLQTAIMVGVLVAILLHVFQQAQKVSLMELVWSNQIFPEERPAPKVLPSNAITTMLVYGSLFFAAAGTFEKLLPAADQAKRAVVILLLRGHTEVGSTFINALTRYAQQLQSNNGKLMLSGVDEMIYTQLEKTGVLKLIGAENVFLTEARLGSALQRAYASALAWLGGEAPTHPHWLDSTGTFQGEEIEEPANEETSESYPVTQPVSPTAPQPVQLYERDPLLYLEELERLAALKDKGVVTEAEFTEKKHRILGL